jgi:hypothetical protein
MVVTGDSSVEISKELNFIDGDVLVPLKVQGIVYWGAAHFVCRIVSLDGTVWYHDGHIDGYCYKIVMIHKCAVVVIYAQD